MPERHLTLEHRIAEQEVEAAMEMELHYLLAENPTDLNTRGSKPAPAPSGSR